jgi:hypothetical protein
MRGNTANAYCAFPKIAPYTGLFCIYTSNDLQTDENTKNCLKPQLFLGNALPRARGLLRSG